MHCRYCGARLQQGMVVCPECGTRQRHRASAVRCAHCQGQITFDLTVCPHCGHEVKPAGPRLGAWVTGVIVFGLIAFWGMGQLHLGQVWAKVADAGSRLASVAQVPDLPNPALAPVSTRTSAPATMVLATFTFVPTATPAVTPTATVEPAATPTEPAPEPAATSSPAPTETAAPTETPTVEPTATATVVATPTTAAESFYTVRAGDTLTVIGERLGIDWELIAQANGLGERSMLRVGQQLRLPAPTPQAPAATTPAAEEPATPTAQPTATNVPVQESTTYHVQAGDTLAVIGQRFGIAWETIAAANQITENTVLQVGQELTIPGTVATLTATPVPVKPTDTPPTPMPEPYLPAPSLIMPGDNTPYSGGDAGIVLQWQPGMELPAGAVYEVNISWTSNGVVEQDSPRTAGTSIRVPTWLWQKADQPARQYQWSIRIVQVSTDGKGGERVIGLSPRSEVRTFFWN